MSSVVRNMARPPPIAPSMSRFARLHAPGAGVHVIGRFTNRDFRMDAPWKRDAYLTRLERALARTDWSLLSYALMSSHVHHATIAGEDPLWHWLKPLHTGFARDLNRWDRRFGPVYAERATAITMPLDRIGVLVPYIHNNPVRAGVVARADDSTWTSHRAWIGLDPCPSFLAAQLGLRLSGFDESASGRAAFDATVRARSTDPSQPLVAQSAMEALRTCARRELGRPVELASPVETADGLRAEVLDVGDAGQECCVALMQLLRVAAAVGGVSVEELQLRSRDRRLVRVRRVIAVAAVRRLGHTAAEVARLLVLSRSAITLLLRDRETVAEDVERVMRVMTASPVARAPGGLASGR